MGKKLLEKASLVIGPRTPVQHKTDKHATVPQVADDVLSKPKTAIGAMAQFTDRQSIAIKEVEVLKDRLKEFENIIPARRIDPKLIRRSKWANRHELSFHDDDFRNLKADIEAEGGNVQAIKVRPLSGGGQFEIVFGHRRHQACLELGFEVLAIVEDVTEKRLFIEMDKENRQRKDLRPFELGVMYAKALDSGLFSSMRKMAEEVAYDQSQLSKAVSLARLPVDIVKAFVNPLDLQYRWASDLVASLQQNPELVLSLAKEIQSEIPRPAAAAVFSRLTEKRGTVPRSKPRLISLKGTLGQVAEMVFNEKKCSVEINLSNIKLARHAELETLIKHFLAA